MVWDLLDRFLLLGLYKFGKISYYMVLLAEGPLAFLELEEPIM